MNDDTLPVWYRGWKFEWWGIDRILWFQVSLDLRARWRFGVVLFGLSLCYGDHVNAENFKTRMRITFTPKGDDRDQSHAQQSRRDGGGHRPSEGPVPGG